VLDVLCRVGTACEGPLSVVKGTGLLNVLDVLCRVGTTRRWLWCVRANILTGSIGGGGEEEEEENKKKKEKKNYPYR
jgi:hypothetical protein